MSLNFSLQRAHPAELDADAIIVAIHEDGSLSTAATALDQRCDGRITRLVAAGDASGKPGRCLMLHGVQGVNSPRVLLVGCGDPATLDTARYSKLCLDSIRALKGSPVKRAGSFLPELDVNGRDASWKLRQAALAADHVSYAYTATRKNPNGGTLLEALVLCGDDGDADALRQASGMAEGIRLTRELGNLPPNICNPAYLAEQARVIAAGNDGVDCDVLEHDAMQKLGMGALLGVAQGSANPPKLIVLKWKGGGDSKPQVLVGKGITFDTGGISLKPGPGMEEMKFDMCGAASVMGTFLAAVKLALPLNLIVVVAAVENMPDGNAYRPSDVLTSMSGQTIEVLNTDAEGRLILCDALTYAAGFEPATLIDVATLTGACVVALGKHAQGLMTKHDDLAAELLAAGETTHDRAWRLPLWDDYNSQIESGFADVANLGGKYAGAITAGCFLARFTEGQRWAHLDIAGTAWDEGRKGLATGRSVALLTQWLMDRVG